MITDKIADLTRPVAFLIEVIRSDYRSSRTRYFHYITRTRSPNIGPILDKTAWRQALGLVVVPRKGHDRTSKTGTTSS